MADVEGVGAIGTEGFWRLGPSGGRSGGRRLVLCFLLPRLFCIIGARAFIKRGSVRRFKSGEEE